MNLVRGHSEGERRHRLSGRGDGPIRYTPAVPRVLSLLLTVLLGATLPAQSPDVALQNDRQVRRDLGPGESDRFIVNAGLADLVRVNVQASGAAAIFEIRDPAGQLLSNYLLPATASTPPEEREVGLLAQRAGHYVVLVRSVGKLAGSYTVVMHYRSAADRAKDLVAATPKSDAPSPRIVRLERDISEGVKGAEQVFWREAAKNGTPLCGGTGRDEATSS